MSDLKAYLDLKKEAERLKRVISDATSGYRNHELELEKLRQIGRDTALDLKEVEAQMKKMEEDASKTESGEES